MNDPKNRKRAAVQPDSTEPAIRCAYDELVSIERLVPNPRNPNRHPAAQLTILAKVIAHQGWRAPIVVSTRSGFIVSGHGRYEAARMLGVTAVPVDYQEFASEADEWAHLVADNRIAELAEADDTEMRTLLSELKAGDFDLELAGFDESAFAGLLAEGAEATPPMDFPAVDENIAVDFRCPKCGYAWSGSTGGKHE